MKNKSIIFFLSVLSIICIFLLIYLFNYNSELEKQVEQKDEIIANSIERDSLLINKTKEYSNTIEKYITNCEFTVNGKKISSNELVKIANKALDENENLKDSLSYFKNLSNRQAEIFPKEFSKLLNQYKDSLFEFKWKAKLVKDDYGISYTIKREGNQLTAIKNSKRIDSALALFPYYKHKLSIDKDGYFVIETDKDYRRNIRKEENKNEN